MSKCDECGHEEHWEYCEYTSQSEYVIGGGCNCCAGKKPPTPAQDRSLREKARAAIADCDSRTQNYHDEEFKDHLSMIRTTLIDALREELEK